MTSILIGHVAIADVTLPFSEVVETIYEGNVRGIPILVPTTLPTNETLYWQVSTTETSYGISFNYAPQCQAMLCAWGSFTAEKGADFSDSAGDYTEGVTLAKGKKARFRLFKGAYLNAFLEWKQGGILYTAQIKNGKKEDIIKLANSAINSRQ